MCVGGVAVVVGGLLGFGVGRAGVMVQGEEEDDDGDVEVGAFEVIEDASSDAPALSGRFRR